MKKTFVNKYKTLNFWRSTFGLALAAMLLPHDLVAASGGNDIVDFTSETAMMNTNAESGNGFGTVGASGKVNVTMTRQGNANNQQLMISTSDLNPNTAYVLTAYLGDDTNATNIADFTTDKKGAFKVTYVEKSQGKPNSKMEPLPDALDPMCNVRELDIVDGNTNTVLRADLTNPDKGQYLVKLSMNNTGFLPAAAGNLLVKADADSTQFRLQASRLTPSTDYSLVINNNVVQVFTSDTAGKLTLTDLPTNSPDVLDIQTVALADATGTNIVLITEGLGIPCTLAGQSPPTVSYTVPTNAATGVAINDKIAATFSEMMDSSTIGTGSFTLKQGATPVAGAVTYAGVTAVFKPNTNLKANTLYTATITTEARDLTENGLASNFVWSFTTGTQIDTNSNSKSINLGAASTFAILATAAISGAGDQINGDVGLHPGSAQGINPSEINGTIHVNDQAVIDAQNSLLAAYNQAVSRSANAQSLPGDLGGLTLAPGLYVNGSSTGISCDFNSRRPW
jgi:hypothetical protein